MERRDFIKVSALAGGGLVLTLSGCTGYSQADEKAKAISADINAFLKISTDGEILFQFSKHEMGQGVSTALAMILAEELCADWARVHISFPDLDLAKYENKEHGGHGSGGSTTILTMTPILRRAGAVAREMLIKAASIAWSVPTEECSASNHEVAHMKTNRRKAFGELAAAASLQEPPLEYKLKERSAFGLIGKPKVSKLIPKIATGKLKYAIDAHVPGMLYAVIARCPVHGGKLKSFQAAPALSVPGVRKVVTTTSVAGYRDIMHGYEVREGVAVVADSVWAAMNGRDALEIEWEEGVNGKRGLKDFEKILETAAMGDTKPTGYIGDVDAFTKLKNTGKVLKATYVFPYQLHAPMEPLNCIAHFKGESCEFWIGNQGPENLVNEVSRDFGLKPENISVHLYPSGGGFGRRYKADFGIEAACISREVGNLPVKLLWTREDDHLTNFAHIYQRMDYNVILDESDRISVWYEKDSRSYDFGRKTVGRELSWIGYDIPNVRYDMINQSGESLLQSAPWRAVTANGFALSECFIDEIANELEKDPYEFRLSMLKEGRDVDVGHDHPVSNTRLLATL